MTQLYQADWQLMFSRSERALSSYEKAFNDLTEAGVSRDLANQYFSSTMLLPAQDFHTTLADALAARIAQPNLASIEKDSGADTSLYFAEWSVNFPYVRAPTSQHNWENLDSNFALFSFDVSGINEISRWLSRQTVQELGVLMDVTLLRSELSSTEDREDVLQRIQSLDFRPRLVDGRPEQSSATLVYQPAQESLVRVIP